MLLATGWARWTPAAAQIVGLFPTAPQAGPVPAPAPAPAYQLPLPQATPDWGGFILKAAAVLIVVVVMYNVWSKLGDAPKGPTAARSSDGPALAAFRKVVKAYRDDPGRFASSKDHERH